MRNESSLQESGREGPQGITSLSQLARPLGASSGWFQPESTGKGVQGMSVLRLSLPGREGSRGQSYPTAWFHPHPHNHTAAEKEWFTKVTLDKQKQPVSAVHTDWHKRESHFPITSLWPLWSPAFSFFWMPPPPLLAALGLSDTGETAWWLQSVESSVTCRYCLGLWCRINWRHKKNGILKFSLSSKAAGASRTRDLNFMPSITWAASFENEEFPKCWPWK